MQSGSLAWAAQAHTVTGSPARGAPHPPREDPAMHTTPFDPAISLPRRLVSALLAALAVVVGLYEF